MDLYEAVLQRRSVRKYDSRPVSEDVLMRILEAGRLAPSAWNSQPWKFVVVEDGEMRRRVAELCGSDTRPPQMWIADAPVVIVAVATETDRVMSCDITAWPVDMAIAVDHLTLAAAAEGLGTCWIGSFRQGDLKELLGVPPEMMISAVLPLGTPIDEAKAKKRKELADIICYDGFE